MWKENPFSRIFVESEESKKKKKHLHQRLAQVSLKKKMSCLNACTSVWCTGGGRRDTHTGSRAESREKESRLFAVAILPWSSPASVSVSLRSCTAYSRAVVVAQLWRNGSSFLSPLSRSSFHDETQWDCDCTVKTDPFRRAMGENSPAVAPLNVICTNGEGEKGCKSWEEMLIVDLSDFRLNI